jgi:asparagine synthase (glutamine-hydrolysing)
VDTKLWLPDYLLLRGDKLTMAASLEARVPLLDHKLVEFAAQLPPQLKINGLVRKYLLKRVSSKWLPPENINRKKKGFPVPVPEWLRGSARPFMRDLLNPSRIRERGLFNPDFVERLMTEHEQGAADHASTIYGLLSLELWQQQFMDKTPQRVLDRQHG